jgi:hypothetical protein
MPTVTLLPTEDAYVVGNAGVDNKNFGKDTRLWISSDSYPKFSATGKYHETAWTYLKFNLGNVSYSTALAVELPAFRVGFTPIPSSAGLGGSLLPHPMPLVKARAMLIHAFKSLL